jgi:hypothetical protein
MQILRRIKSWYGRGTSAWDGSNGVDADLVHIDNHLPNITYTGIVTAGTAASAAPAAMPGLAQLFVDGTYAVTNRNINGVLTVQAYPAMTGALASDGVEVLVNTGASWVNIFTHMGSNASGAIAFFDRTKGAIRYGGGDPFPLNDERDYWSGMTSKDAWGDPANIGLYSAAFNRNGMSKAVYSTTFGHDCITMGTASVAGGAGSATGDPADPLNAAYTFNGYCAIAWGKNVIARGEKSYSFGEEGQSNSRASGTMGYANKTNKALVGHPNSQGGTGVASDGIGAFSVGYLCESYGDGAVAIGKNVKSYNGAQTFGNGINPGNQLTNSYPGSVGFGANTVRPTMLCIPGDGNVSDFGKAASMSAHYLLVDVNVNNNVLGAAFTATLTNGGGGGYVKPEIKGLRLGALTTMFEVDPITMVPKFFGNSINFGSQRTVASASEPGEQGEICWDASYIYVCISGNTWKRTAITGW